MELDCQNKKYAANKRLIVMLPLKITRFLLLITATLISVYWVTVALGLFPLEELVPGYTQWFLSFPVPDFYIAVSAALGVWYLPRNRPLAAVFIVMAGSGLIFLGLYALLYGIITGLIFIPTIDELIEIAIKLYCLIAGPYLIRSAWKHLMKPYLQPI